MKELSIITIRTLINWSTNTLHKKINARGYYEQEKQFLFPSLYGSKAVRKQTAGRSRHAHRELIKRDKAERRVMIINHV
jgi:hypothetical protein